MQELYLGEDNYALVRIPPLVWNGFKGIGPKTAIVANCTTIPYDPKEIIRLDPMENHLPYSWNIKNR